MQCHYTSMPWFQIPMRSNVGISFNIIHKTWLCTWPYLNVHLIYVNARAPVRSINDMVPFNQQHRISQDDGTEYPLWNIPYESHLSTHHDSVANTGHRSTQREIIVHMSGKCHYMSTLSLTTLVLVSEYSWIEIIMYSDALALCITTTCYWLYGKIPFFFREKEVHNLRQSGLENYWNPNMFSYLFWMNSAQASRSPYTFSDGRACSAAGE